MKSSRPAPGASSAPASPGPESSRESAGSGRTASAKVERQAARARKALNALAADTPSPSTKQLLAALTDAGFAKRRLEATRSTTPLKNDVPAVMYGIKVGPSSCIVGEVRAGVATVTVTNPVENGKRCLIGVVDSPNGGGATGR
ncbi:hypothetical protein GCM10027344_29680 [Spelaeicoccus albus]